MRASPLANETPKSQSARKRERCDRRVTKATHSLCQPLARKPHTLPQTPNNKWKTEGGPDRRGRLPLAAGRRGRYGGGAGMPRGHRAPRPSPARRAVPRRLPPCLHEEQSALNAISLSSAPSDGAALRSSCRCAKHAPRAVCLSGQRPCRLLGYWLGQSRWRGT